MYMNEVQVSSIAVMAVAGLSVFRIALSILIERRAIRMYWRCLDTARTAGVEESFMDRFNSEARIGDSLGKVCRDWGSTRIRRMCEEALRQA